MRGRREQPRSSALGRGEQSLPAFPRGTWSGAEGGARPGRAGLGCPAGRSCQRCGAAREPSRAAGGGPSGCGVRLCLTSAGVPKGFEV